MSQVARLMTIKTRESENGVFFATSEDEPTFFVATTSSDSLEEAVRRALEELYSTLHHKEVTALPTDKGDFKRKPWAIVPKEAMDFHPDC